MSSTAQGPQSDMGPRLFRTQSVMKEVWFQVENTLYHSYSYRVCSTVQLDSFYLSLSLSRSHFYYHVDERFRQDWHCFKYSWPFINDSLLLHILYKIYQKNPVGM